MRSFACLIIIMTCLVNSSARADLLPPGAIEAGERLRKNPGAFDRTDDFCDGKKANAACMIPGSLLAGGGDGICRNEINRNGGQIDLSCVRTDAIAVDRKLPEGGYVYDADLCSQKDPDGKPLWNCTPLAPPPADQFCKEKELDASCTVTLRYRGKTEEQSGICKMQTQTISFYRMGHRSASREVVLCSPQQSAPEQNYHPVGWWQKLWQ